MFKFLFVVICLHLFYNYSHAVIVREDPVRLIGGADGSVCSPKQCPDLPINSATRGINAPVITSKITCFGGQLQSILLCPNKHYLLSVNGEPGSFYAIVADCINGQWMQDKTIPLKFVSCQSTTQDL